MPIYPSSTTTIDNDTIKENSTGEIYADAANIAPNMIDGITIQQNSSGTIYIPSMIGGGGDSLSSYEGTNAQNIYFSSDSAGSTKLNSWLESGYSNSYGTTHNWWVKIPSISANSSITIYLQLSPTTTNNYNTSTTGVNPVLTSTYAEYDNGSNVFVYYDNFAGTTLSSAWTIPTDFTYTVNNGFTATVPTTNPSGSAYNSSVSEEGYINEWYMLMTSIGSASTNFQLNRYTGSSNMFFMGNTTVGCVNAGTTLSTPTISATSGSYATFGIQNQQTSVYWYVNYTSAYSTTSATTENDYLSLSWLTTGAGASFPTIYFVRQRIIPPNNTMPTVSVGTLKSGGAGNYIPITLTNNQSTATTANMQQYITIDNNSVINTQIYFQKQNLTAQTTTSTSAVNIDTAIVKITTSGQFNINAIVRASNNTIGDGTTISLYNGSTLLDSETYTQEGLASNSHTFVLFYPLQTTGGNSYTINLTMQSVSGGTVSAKEVLFAGSEA